MPPDRYESPEENLARLLRRKRYAQAIDTLRARLAQRRPDPRTRLRLADLLVAAGRAAEAVPLLLALSDELAATGELSKAVAALKRVERIEPQRADLQRRLQRLVAERHRLLTPAEEPRAEGEPAPPPTEAGHAPEPAGAPPEALAAEAPAQLDEEPADNGAPADDKVAVRFRGLLGRLLGGRTEAGEGPPDAADRTAPRYDGPEIGLAPLPAASTPEPPPARAEPLPEAPAGRPTPPPAALPPPTPAPVPTLHAAVAPTPLERATERRSGLRGLLGRLFGRADEPGPGEAAPSEPEATLPPPALAPPEPAPVAEPVTVSPTNEPGPASEEPSGTAPEPAPAPVEVVSSEPPPALQTPVAVTPSEPWAEPQVVAEPEPAVAAPSTVATVPEPEAPAAPPPPMSEDDFHERLLDVVEEMLRRDTPEKPDAALPARRLQSSPLLGELDEAELNALVGRLQLRTCEPGDILLTEGEQGETLFLLVGGTVRISVRNQESHNVAVLELREGDFFGEISVLSGRPRSATVTAATPCELLELDRPTLDDLARGHPGIVDTLEAFYLARTQSADAATLREAGLGPDARRRAEAVLRSHFGAGGFEPRTQLKLADALLRSGKRDDAQAILGSLADDLARHGYPEKAVSILKKIERLQGRGVEEILLAPLRRPAEAPAAHPGPGSTDTPDDAFHGWLLDLVHDTVDRGRPRRAPAPGLLMSPLFEDLGEDELLSLVRGLRLVGLDAGDVVVTEGEAGNSVFVITSGSVKVFVRDPAGRSVLVGRLGEGDFFGEISLLSGRPRSATITAAAPCELLELDREAFERVCVQHPRVRSVMEDVYIQRASHPLAARVRGSGEQG